MSGAKKSDDDDFPEIQIEVVDDTPEEDRNRPVAAEKTESDDDIAVKDDEVSRYREDFQKRLKDLSFKAHAERRAKEAAARERDEAATLAQRLYDENRQLREVAGSNEQAAVGQAKQRAETQIESYRRQAKQALEAGDTDAFIQAQEGMNRAQIEHERFSTYRPPPPPPPPQQVQQPQKPPEPDEKAKAWLARNPWFDADGDVEHEMTGYAFTLHDKLVRRQGVDPRSDEYYAEIDKAVRRRFPEYWKDTQENQASAKSATTPASTVVAPVARTTGTTRTVRLTESQVKIARRLGLTPEQYALQYAKAYPNG